MSTILSDCIDSQGIDPVSVLPKAVLAVSFGSGIGLLGYAMNSFWPGVLGLLTAFTVGALGVLREYVRRDGKHMREMLGETRDEVRRLKARLSPKGIDAGTEDTEDY